MITHTLQQGTNEWHRHRAEHYNASDAAAMLGISPYESRTELLRRYATGISKEIDPATQMRFDDGHRCEELARQKIAEKIIGEELYPVVVSEGKLSGSFDGRSFSGKGFEHKRLNAAIRSLFANNEPLLEYHRCQLEQLLMIDEECDSILFVASEFDGDDILVEEFHRWYTSDQTMRERIMYGWTQFAIDLEEYKRKLAAGEIVMHKEMPKAEVCIDLPALFVRAKGEITEHNMEAFGVALTNKLAEVRAIALVTDQDFSNAKEAAKKFRETAKAIALSKEAMLAQTETIGEAARKMDAWSKDLNSTALQLEKDVEREDLAKKRVMVGDTAALYIAHIEALEAETRPIRLNVLIPVFAEAIKNKRNYASMQGALDDMLANGKISADAVAKDVREKQKWLIENGESMPLLFQDLQQIIFKPMSDFQLVVTSRISQFKRAESAKIVTAQPAQAVQEPNVGQPQEAGAVTPINAVVKHQDAISEFLASRDFGKESGKVRAILVEFVKFLDGNLKPRV